MKKSWKRMLPLLISLGLLVVLAGSVYAALLSTNVLSAWDWTTFRFENGNLRIIFDGDWEPFVHQLDFNTNTSTNQFPRDYPPLGSAPVYWACPTPPTSTIYAGIDEISLYHTDNAPVGGQGFQATRNWGLVYCDRDGDGDYDNDDLSIFPPTAWTPAPECYFNVLYSDIVVPCSTGNCQDEIYSAFYINCDQDCDQVVDQPIPGGGYCLYWEAQKPDCSPPAWSGNFQARLSGIAGGGDKTINFSIDCPTAVGVNSFGASMALPALAVVLPVGAGGAGLLVWRARRRKRQ